MVKDNCEICEKVIDETEANPWKGKYVCNECLVTVKEDEEIELTNEDWGFPQHDSVAAERLE